MKALRKYGIHSVDLRKEVSPFKKFRDREARWDTAIILGPIALSPLYFGAGWYFSRAGAAVPGSEGWSVVIGAALLALRVILSFVAKERSRKELTALLAANLQAPDADGLLIYIEALGSDYEEVSRRAERILSILLPLLSQEQLADIEANKWRYLCPAPGHRLAVPDRYGKKEALNVAVFSAVTRLKRLESLPSIAHLMKSIDRYSHSDTYKRTLRECYRTLLECREEQQSAILLRSASAPGASHTLLRPSHSLQRCETGEQLLRATMSEDTV